MIGAALEKANRLDRLVTRWTFTSRELFWAKKVGLSTRWASRPTSPVARTHLTRVFLADLRARWGAKENALDASFSMVDRTAARFIRPECGAVLAREDACLCSFRQAKELGIPSLYLLPTAYFETVRQLIEEEAKIFPELVSHSQVAFDFAKERTERKAAELKAATHVIAPSTFVAQSISRQTFPDQQVKLLPLGADSSWTAPFNRHRENIFLFVGNLSPRKGVHRLIRTWKTLGAHRTHRLRLIGDMQLAPSFLAEYRGIFEHVPRMPRNLLPAEYSRAQAFVFNALADGFGHVFAEAMVCGTPVLATHNCGAPDLVTDGLEGKLFDYGNDDDLAAVLDWALNHPSELLEMGLAARQKALSWGWGEFQKAFFNWIMPLLAEREARCL